MSIELTALIISQAKTLVVMAAAGVLVETFWQIKKRVKRKKRTAAVFFWAATAFSLPAFLYYCAYGRPTVHAALGFFAGLILWKKICCGIIKKVWVENDEAENLKTTAALSTSRKQENRGWKKGGRREKKKKNA